MKHNRPNHPADAAARVRLMRELAEHIANAGLSQGEFARRLGSSRTVPNRFVGCTDPNPSVKTLARYGAQLRIALAMTLLGTDVPKPDYAGSRPGGDMVAWLRVIRRRRRISQPEVARRGGWSEASFRHVELGTAGLWISTIQRYGRALDCPVEVWWEEC